MEPPAFMPSQPSLCTLPVELTQAILCHLPDLESLKSAQLTHSALYHAFLGAEDLITGEVLTREIPTDLFPDAVFAFNASTVEGRWARDKVQSILYQHRNRQIPSSFRLTRKSAFAIYGLYRWVRYFARDFLATALADPWHGLTHPAIPSRPPTLTEECRVARALYRFEIHRHLFRMREPYEGYSKDSPDFRVGEQWGYYFRHFPVWELEQIMSVCEHLFRRIAIYLRPLATADARWIEEGIWYYSSHVSLMTHPSPVGTLLTRGLLYMGRVVTARYLDRYELLANELFRKPFISSLPDILPAICDPQRRPHSSVTYDEGQTLDWQGTDIAGSDPGPANSWRTMMQSAVPHEAELAQVGMYSTHELRRQGYVFWDEARLVEGGRRWTNRSRPLYNTAWMWGLQQTVNNNRTWRPLIYHNERVGRWWFPKQQHMYPIPVVRLPPT